MNMIAELSSRQILMQEHDIWDITLGFCSSLEDNTYHTYVHMFEFMVPQLVALFESMTLLEEKHPWGEALRLYMLLAIPSSHSLLST